MYRKYFLKNKSVLSRKFIASTLSAVFCAGAFSSCARAMYYSNNNNILFQDQNSQFNSQSSWPKFLGNKDPNKVLFEYDPKTDNKILDKIEEEIGNSYTQDDFDKLLSTYFEVDKNSNKRKEISRSWCNLC